MSEGIQRARFLGKKAHGTRRVLPQCKITMAKPSSCFHFVPGHMAYEEDKEVDWSGLVAVGSLLGNLLQYTEKNNLEKTLHWTGERLRAIAEDRERVIAMLHQVQKAYAVLKADADRMAATNKDLLTKLTESESEKGRLRNEVTELKEAIGILEKRLNDAK